MIRGGVLLFNGLVRRNGLLSFVIFHFFFQSSQELIIVRATMKAPTIAPIWSFSLTPWLSRCSIVESLSIINAKAGSGISILHIRVYGLYIKSIDESENGIRKKYYFFEELTLKLK